MSDVERMLRDVHPADVVLNDGTVLTGVRVFLTNKRCSVWSVDKTTNKLSRPIDFEVTQTNAVASRSTLGDGERIEVFGLTQGLIINKGRGCGCGSKLKALSTPVKWTR